MKSLWQLLSGRRMCRCYIDKSVPRAVLLRVLEAARRAPSAGHSQGVRFAVVSCSQKRREIARAFGEDEFVERGFQPWLSVAPVHLVVAVSSDAYRERYALPDKKTRPQEWPVPYQVMDCGKALMALYLAAEESGLACGYLGPHAGPDLVEFLGLPEEWTFAGLVTIGYRDPTEGSTRSQRMGWRSFDEVVHWLS